MNGELNDSELEAYVGGKQGPIVAKKNETPSVALVTNSGSGSCSGGSCKPKATNAWG